jgi:hypothetical protein
MIKKEYGRRKEWMVGGKDGWPEERSVGEGMVGRKGW